MEEDTFINQCAKDYWRGFCKTAGALTAIVLVAAMLPKNTNATVTTPNS